MVPADGNNWNWCFLDLKMLAGQVVTFFIEKKNL